MTDSRVRVRAGEERSGTYSTGRSGNRFQSLFIGPTMCTAIALYLLPTAFGANEQTEPWRLGHLTLEGDADQGTPLDYESIPFRVSHRDLASDVLGWMAVGHAVGDPVGVVVGFTGTVGTTYWSDQTAQTWQLGEDLRALGYTIIQVRWSTSWWSASVEAREDAGVGRLAARPATVINWIHAQFCQSEGIPLMITGNSGGAGQAAYALSHYGLDSLIAKAIFTGGPPFCALAKSCMNIAGDEDYWFNSGKLDQIDKAHGFPTGTGPATNHDPGFIPRWNEESIAYGGNDYLHPGKIIFLIGENDPRMQTIAKDYRDKLLSNPQNDVTWTIVPDTPHLIYATRAGIDAVFLAITQDPGIDHELPIIGGIPEDIVAMTDPNQATARVSWIAPEATDNAGIVSFESTYEPGSTFPLGTTTIIYTATDESGNQATSSFSVTVVDKEPPVLKGLPTANIVSLADANSRESTVRWQEPQATDNSGFATIEASHPSGSSFPLGITTVTYTARDGAGHETRASFTVTVELEGAASFRAWHQARGFDEAVDPYDDVNRDGYANVFHYLWNLPLDRSPWEHPGSLCPSIDAAVFPNRLAYAFKMPEELPKGLTVSVESSVNAVDWGVLATRTAGDGEWQFRSPVSVATLPALNGLETVGIWSGKTHTEATVELFRIRAALDTLTSIE